MHWLTLKLMAPELWLLATAALLFFGDIFEVLKGSRALIVFECGVIVSLISLFNLSGPAAHSTQILGGRFALDGLAWWMKLLFLSGAALTAPIADTCAKSKAGQPPECHADNEFYLTLLFSVIGGCFLASARDIVTLYVSIELASIPLYLLASWRRDERSSEAGLKYLLLGSAASAVLLFGLSLLYAMTGATALDAISHIAAAGPATVPAVWLAMALVIGGSAFKFALAPFHFWAPDVYEGAPTAITAYLSVVSKGIALMLMFSLLYIVFGHITLSIPLVFAAIAAITMTWGNIAAIRQTNIKRLLAYSGISQAGYILLGFIGNGPKNMPAMIYYLLVYLFSNMAVFAVVGAVTENKPCNELRDFRGLSRTNPLLALSMTLALFSLAGIPPLSGFVGKFFLFSIASRAGMHWLVALAALNSTVSLYYYLGVVREMYIEKVEGGNSSAAPRPLSVRPLMRITLGVTLSSVIFFGLVPIFYNSIFSATSGWIGMIIR